MAFQVAAPSASVTVDGNLTFTPASGSLIVAGVNHDATPGAPSGIAGRLVAGVKPTAGDQLDLAISGDARSATLGAARIVAPMPEQKLAAPWGWIAVTVGAVGLGVVAVVVIAKKRRVAAVAEPPNRKTALLATIPTRGASYAERANEMAALAHEQADDRQWDSALDLMAKARALHDQPVLAYYHGWYLYRAGRPEEALKVLDIASYSVDTGHVEHVAAWCVVELMAKARLTDADPEELHALEEKGAYYLARALERAKIRDLVVEIMDDLDFCELREKPAVREAMEEARRRFVI
jgi:hypothetical protein